MKFVIDFELRTQGKMLVEADNETEAKKEMYHRIYEWFKSADSKKLGLFKRDKQDLSRGLFAYVSSVELKPFFEVEEIRGG